MRLISLGGGVARTCALAAGMAMLMSGAASAGTVVLKLTAPTGDLGHSHTYKDMASGLSILATGYNDHAALTDLWGKAGTGDENGLGLANDPTGDHEIHYGKGFVQFDVRGLLGKVLAGSTKFATNSTTNKEEWGVFGSNTAGSYSGAPLLTGTTESTQALPDWGLFKFYDFVELGHPAGQGDNFLLGSVTTVHAVPEPATWAMMLVGFFGLGGMMRSARGRPAAA